MTVKYSEMIVPLISLIKKGNYEHKLIVKRLTNILTLGRSLHGERHLSRRQPSAELKIDDWYSSVQRGRLQLQRNFTKMGCFEMVTDNLYIIFFLVGGGNAVQWEKIPMSSVFVGVELGGTDDICQNDRCCSSTVYSAHSSCLCEGLSWKYSVDLQSRFIWGWEGTLRNNSVL